MFPLFLTQQYLFKERPFAFHFYFQCLFFLNSSVARWFQFPTKCHFNKIYEPKTKTIFSWKSYWKGDFFSAFRVNRLFPPESKFDLTSKIFFISKARSQECLWANINLCWVLIVGFFFLSTNPWASPRPRQRKIGNCRSNKSASMGIFFPFKTFFLPQISF